MNPPSTREPVQISVNTPAGQVTTEVEVPVGFVPITAIVPLMRGLGESALALEVRRVVEAGRAISCQKGCAACCRMLVPVSAPEAFALRQKVNTLPDNRRQFLLRKVQDAKQRLAEAGLLARLTELAETTRPVGDHEFEPLNQAYYDLRMPCPFLENETCSIYEDRPAACRELLVTSPAELCEDLAKNPVRPIPVSVRISTALGLLWSDLMNQAPRLIALPLALEWADRQQHDNQQRWKGADLLDRALDKVWRLLSQEFTKRSE